MRRLYLQIYLAFVAMLLLFGLLAGSIFLLTHDDSVDARWRAGLGEIAAELLPAPDRPVTEMKAVLTRYHDSFGVDFAVAAADGRVIAAVGNPMPSFAPDRDAGGWMFGRGRGWRFAVRLPDGRWFLARHASRFGGPRFVGPLIPIAIAIAIGTYPIARRISGRLERLQRRVEALGAGDLSARVAVEGKDEVADLARSFNHTADRIERLVGAQRSMLAGASHELRSPLARIRMAVELLAGDDRPELKERIGRDIADLDELIDELLMASRLQTIQEVEGTEEVDLLALLAEEGARVGAKTGGTTVHVQGNVRLLRRLARNLFDNADRYGGGSPIEASVERLDGARGRLAVEDAGPGVPEAELERIFEPFYRPAGREEGRDRGVGLGLALVRQIARHHGGDVRCLPRDGGGTRFEVTLPLM